MKILLAEDSPKIRKYTAMALEHAGLTVDTASDGAEALWSIEEGAYDVVILDIMMPKLSGMEVLERIREKGNTVHVLMLTAMDAVEDKVAGLRSGADDYLVKPFEIEELIARIEVLGRRSYGVKSSVLSISEVVLDTAGKFAEVMGKRVGLTSREYALLEYLMLRRCEVVSRAEIEEHIYDMNADLMSNTVNSAVSLLRKKLENAGASQFIETRRGLGYGVDLL